MNKRFLVILVAVIAVFAGLVVINKKDTTAPSGNGGGQVTNHTFGSGSTGVNVTEYGDFQCPACATYYPIFAQLKEQYKDRVTFQFRHFPLISSHQNAMAASRAAEAASLQDKFWEMHNLLYERQDAWESSNNAAGIFEGYATELGLDLAKFKTDVSSNSTNASIQADFKAGQDLGVSGTPSFAINGKLIDSPNSFEAFKEAIDNAIKEKTGQ
jgi:protein-disulfide isomerase